MKKESVVSLSVIIGLLILCVLVLLAVYASIPETVVLLEESFDVLDEKKWRHEVSECREDSEQFHYVTDDESNRITADGMLRIYPNLTEVKLLSKRDVPHSCYSCNSPENSTSDCVPSLFSAKVQSKSAFNATRGRIELRVRLCCGDAMRFQVGIVQNQSSSVPDEILRSLDSSGEGGGGNNSGELNVLYESDGNTTVLKSPVNDSEFHVYEINWDREKISLSIDSKRVDEEKFELFDSQEEYFSNTTAKLDSPPISKPFYILLGVSFGEQLPENSGNHSDHKRSPDGEANESEDSVHLEVDYVRVLRI